MVDTFNVLDRYFTQLSTTGNSNETMKVFIASVLCDWKDEIVACNYEWLSDLNRLCSMLDGSSCVFQFESNC